MEKKELLRHLKHRWRVVHDFEVKEVRKTPLKDRFNLTSIIFNSGKSLKLSSRKSDLDTHAIITRWRQLKDYYSEAK